MLSWRHADLLRVRRGVHEEARFTEERRLEVWRLRCGDHIQTCELRDNTQAGAGWDVLVLEDGEPVFSRRCVDEPWARYVAECFRKDSVRAGCTES